MTEGLFDVVGDVVGDVADGIADILFPLPAPRLGAFRRPPTLQIAPPRYIALCGYPGVGKSQVATLLEELYGVIPVDDGLVLRTFAVDHLGLSWDDVSTQEGKARTTAILDQEWVNRDILGTLGQKLEEMFGAHIMPFIATQGLAPGRIYSFPSVRKTQGWFYRERSGIVVEVIKRGRGPRYDFDHYDATAVTHTINNHTMDLDVLRSEIRRVLGPLLDPGCCDVV